MTKESVKYDETTPSFRDCHKEGRIGTFVLNRDILEQMPHGEWDAMMAGVRVVRCEMMYANEWFEYAAISLHFDALGESAHMIMPTYKPVFELCEVGKDGGRGKMLFVKWERVD